MRLYVLARHAQSTLNLEQRINGDPSQPAPLTEQGRGEAALLGLELRGLPLDRCVHTRFPRTRETAEIATAGRQLEWHVEPLLDDIDVGDLDGRSISDYRAWKREHGRNESFPGGESLDDAARRFVTGFRNVLASQARATLVVCHEIPIRYVLNTLGGSADLDGPVHKVPNAVPFVVDDEALGHAADRIEQLVPA